MASRPLRAPLLPTAHSSRLRVGHDPGKPSRKHGWQTALRGENAGTRRLRSCEHCELAVYEPSVAVLASSRSVAMRFCSVRRLIPNISAVRLRLPST